MIFNNLIQFFSIQLQQNINNRAYSTKSFVDSIVQNKLLL